ncbi:MAG: phosphoribosylanthranilate isomerase [Chloroflexi bacterium]|nr:phosphoribosylanthranilate isomerase [Ardenticatenaceae bacterium]MBL1127343.1 phosphoribosylanthranilate isomerase [Chloroflexota bacterium]NOG33404.1 phosphoribosylanthranilate isomerase [Chloroflexota bacterium]GIK57193.1 MAG: N-(5'-phosphoribosyl)anthranilate isomerase [Chloroflexota bacterium]
MVKVKICGTTNLEDALLAAEAGADFLGFIFYPPGKRSITLDVAQAITIRLRQLDNCPVLVGVFVNETPERMAEIMAECQLDLAQLHGDEPPWLVGDTRSPLYGRAFKALRPTSLVEAETDAEWYVSPQSPNLLIDAYHPTLRGGTGQTADWSVCAHLARQIPGLMLAGGLTPENVAEAVRVVRPYAVDVASGVEISPGRKDPALVRAFIANAKSVIR